MGINSQSVEWYTECHRKWWHNAFHNGRTNVDNNSNPDTEVHPLWMTMCVMQMPLSERRHIQLTGITTELAISLGTVHNQLIYREVCARGNLMDDDKNHCMGLSLMHLTCYRNHREQLLQCPVTQVETSVTHLTPERKEKHPRRGKTHLPQQTNLDVISKKDHSSCLLGPQISASCGFL